MSTKVFTAILLWLGLWAGTTFLLAPELGAGVWPSFIYLSVASALAMLVAQFAAARAVLPPPVMVYWTVGGAILSATCWGAFGQFVRNTSLFEFGMIWPDFGVMFGLLSGGTFGLWLGVSSRSRQSPLWIVALAVAVALVCPVGLRGPMGTLHDYLALAALLCVPALVTGGMGIGVRRLLDSKSMASL